MQLDALPDSAKLQAIFCSSKKPRTFWWFSMFEAFAQVDALNAEREQLSKILSTVVSSHLLFSLRHLWKLAKIKAIDELKASSSFIIGVVFLKYTKTTHVTTYHVYIYSLSLQWHHKIWGFSPLWCPKTPKAICSPRTSAPLLAFRKLRLTVIQLKQQVYHVVRSWTRPS